LLRVALEGESLPVVRSGAGGTVQGQPESAAAHWLPVSPRVTRSAPMAWARCARPGARGSRVTASCYALGAEGGGAARPGAYMCFRRNCARCLLGGGRDVEDVVRCAVLERLGARRASNSCRGRGWSGTPRGPHSATASATLERSAGTVAHGKRAARERRRRRSHNWPLQGLAPPARRPRAAGAPWEARARAARVQTADKA